MTPPAKDPGGSQGPPQEGPGRLLAELRRTLTEQLEAARRGDMDSCLKMCGTIRRLLESMAPGTTPPACREDIQDVRRLHDQLCLILATQKAEVKEKLLQSRRGRAAAQAYAPDSTGA